MLATILAGALAAALLLLRYSPARADEFQRLNKDVVYCQNHWCLAHEDTFVFVTQDAATRLCGWVK